MARFFTTHWQYKYWNGNNNREGARARSSGSNQYLKRGLSQGDHVYVVSLSRGFLYLGGRIVVDQIVDRRTAVKRYKNSNLHDSTDWIIGDEEQGTPLNFHRRLSADISKQLRFVSSDGEIKDLFFTSATELDVQATRGVRELTSASAALLEQILAVTDNAEDASSLLDVTLETVAHSLAEAARQDAKLPNEPSEGETFREGMVSHILVNRYERDPKARAACIATHGATCIVCHFDFAKTYGAEYAGFIHVHHLRPLSDVGDEYQVDPENDMVPICPNCHAAIHRRDPPLTIDELKGRLPAPYEEE